MPPVAAVAAVASAGAVAADIGITAAAIAEVGAVVGIVGAVTGSKTLSEIGMGMGVGGGIASLTNLGGSAVSLGAKAAPATMAGPDAINKAIDGGVSSLSDTAASSSGGVMPSIGAGEASGASNGLAGNAVSNITSDGGAAGAANAAGSAAAGAASGSPIVSNSQYWMGVNPSSGAVESVAAPAASGGVGATQAPGFFSSVGNLVKAVGPVAKDFGPIISGALQGAATGQLAQAKLAVGQQQNQITAQNNAFMQNNMGATPSLNIASNPNANIYPTMPQGAGLIYANGTNQVPGTVPLANPAVNQAVTQPTNSQPTSLLR